VRRISKDQNQAKIKNNWSLTKEGGLEKRKTRRLRELNKKTCGNRSFWRMRYNV